MEKITPFIGGETGFDGVDRSLGLRTVLSVDTLNNGKKTLGESYALAA